MKLSIKGYLIFYNTSCALLWLIILLKTGNDLWGYYFGSDLLLHPTWTSHNIYLSKGYQGFPHKLMFYVQLLNAIVETNNSLCGLVKSPIFTTFLQFTARLLIVIGVTYELPQSPGNYNHWAYPGLSLAWSITEVIRYSFYVSKLVSYTPFILTLLRYNSFLILYPVGLISESFVVFQSLESAKALSIRYYYFLVFALASYVPGFLVLYSYMLKQRKKALFRVPEKDKVQ